MFQISNITYARYIVASAIGMAPSQGMHAYIGSTLRSMEEVMAGGSSKSPTACLVFVAQVSTGCVIYCASKLHAIFDAQLIANLYYT